MNGGFHELSEARIHVPETGSWTFRVDDEPLDVDHGTWVWRPGFYAGEVTAELVAADGATVATYLLDVAPDDRNMGRERFQDLLDEIVAEDPALITGAEPATLAVGTEHSFDDPLVALARYSRLRAHATPFSRAVREVGLQPRTSMHVARAYVELHRVRCVDVQSVRAMARTGAVVALADEAGVETEFADASGDRIRVDVPIRETTVDCPANRCLLAFIHLVRQRARSVREWLASAQATPADSETRTSLAKRAPQRIAILDRIDGELWRLLRGDPWKQVTRPEITAAGLNALAADPRYARVNQLAWKILRTGIGGATPADRLWLSPTWEIFERWCFVRLARLVRERFPEYEWKRASRPNSLACWEGRKPGATLAVMLQPRFPSWDQPSNSGFKSVSRERYPDILLTAEWGSTRRFILLDAKYRRSRGAVLDAMESAHIYQDSLRWDGARADLSLLILPAAPETVWLTDDRFHAFHRVGAFVLGEGLPREIGEFLRAPPSDAPQLHS